ncbi:MAG TPA: hypothetical protein VM935_19950, partial [Chitinophagaceae bacterium]|nr:hypothetical protein [Chitinophagaceae bacterium]
MAKATTTPTIFYIFGGSGDLTQRKLIPALYNLFIDGSLPDQFMIIGIGRTEHSPEQYKELLKKGILSFSRRKEQLDQHWEAFSGNIEYFNQDLLDDKTYETFRVRIEDLEKTWQQKPNLIFYFSVAPQLAPEIAKRLCTANLCHDTKHSRLVFEKPFGHDLETARELNALLQKLYKEEQIYRIDHFLGKETVQNILALRFANTLFEPCWNSHYI